MTVTRRGDSPYYVIDFVYKGRRYKKSASTRIKAEAIAMEAEMRKKLKAEDRFGPTTDITFGEAATRYLETVIAPRGRPKQTRHAQNRINQLLLMLPGNLSVQRITEIHVARVKEAVLARGCVPSTVNRYLIDLSAILSYCERELGALVRKPKICKMKQGPHKTRFLTLEEEERMLSVAPFGYREMLIFMLGTGARRNEAMTLKWSEVNLQTGKRTTVSFLNTKNGKDHGVPVPSHVENMLRKMFSERPKNFDYVFHTKASWNHFGHEKFPACVKGDPLPIRNPDQTFRIIRAKANLPDVSFHTLRHTYASRLVMAGVPIFEVCKLLNHSSVEQTMRYAHLAPNHLDGAVSKLDDTISRK